MVFAARIFGTERLGTVRGLITMDHHTMGGLGAFVGALIFDQTGSYDGAFVLILALVLVAAFATMLVRERPLTQAAARA